LEVVSIRIELFGYLGVHADDWTDLMCSSCGCVNQHRIVMCTRNHIMCMACLEAKAQLEQSMRGSRVVSCGTHGCSYTVHEHDVVSKVIRSMTVVSANRAAVQLAMNRQIWAANALVSKEARAFAVQRETAKLQSRGMHRVAVPSTVRF
jgi:hypothetical protein